MTLVRGRTTAHRLAVTAVAAGLCTAGMTALASPAQAGGRPDGTVEQYGGAQATLVGLTTHGPAVIRTDGERQEVSAGLFEMTVAGGGSLQTYGLDALNPVQAQTRYAEGSWKSSTLHGNRNAGKIRWILEHSYPKVNDLQKLADAAGTRHLTPQSAAAGTQVAIWRFAEAGSQRPDDHTHDKARGHTGDSAHGTARHGRPEITAVDPAAEKLADRLVENARSMPEPGASLALGPAEVSGRNGDRVGPVTVRTNATTVSVAPDPHAVSRGVRIVDKEGKETDTAHNGSRLYFDVPPGSDPGSASLTAEAATKIPAGRVFTQAGGRGRSQTQILAGSSRSTVSATAGVNWAPKGPVPAATFEEDCAKGGVGITVANHGDEPFTLRAGGQRAEIPQDDTRTVMVPVEEDQPYRIPVAGPNGYEKTFSGVLDCATSAATDSVGPHGAVAGGERPATVGGGEAVMGSSKDLAETGSGGTHLMALIAVGFVVAGGVTMILVRRRA